MADDYQDIGTEPIFTFDLDWVSTPKTEMVLSKNVIQQMGTVQTLGSYTDDVPQSFNGQFTIESKLVESNFLTFIHEQRGKNNRFWFLHPKQSFVLKTLAASGVSTVICEPNRAYSSYEGYERIWIGMNNGDILTRHVFSVTNNAPLGEMTLNLSTNLDREVNLTNHYAIGRCLLVRFDDDKFDFKIITDIVSRMNLRFFELPLEYSEI